MGNLGTLAFSFTSDQRVLVADGIPSGARGPIPHHVLYPFVMAGKLMFNFSPIERKLMSGTAARAALALQSIRASDATAFGLLSSGYHWAHDGARGKHPIEAVFLDYGGMLACTTSIPWRNPEGYERAAIEAALDYARFRAAGSDQHIMKAIMTFFEVYRDNEVPNAPHSVLLATMSAMAAATGQT